MKTTASFIIVFLAMLTATFTGAAEPLRFFVGTYTSVDGSKGIYTGRFDAETGTLEELTLAAECENPAFLALHPTKPYLYAVSETGNGKLLAFQCSKRSGRLTPLDEKEVAGQSPCHLALCLSEDGETDAVVVANYGGGNVVSFPILGSGKIGKIASDIAHIGSGPNASRQTKPHPHGTYFDIRTKTVAVPDLGIDQVIYYQIDLVTAKLSRSLDLASLRLPAGGGPRHLAATKDQRFVYVLNELDSTISVFDRITPKYPKLVHSISTLTEGKDAAALKNTTAEIELHPNGKFLYASNRGDDSIAVFSVDKEKLTLIQNAPSGGQTPRFFCLDPTGRFLLACNQNSGTICVLAVDPETGKLTSTGKSVNVSKPVCIVFASTY